MCTVCWPELRKYGIFFQDFKYQSAASMRIQPWGIRRNSKEPYCLGIMFDRSTN